MSKASELAKLQAGSRWNATGFFADVDTGGNAAICSRYSDSVLRLDAEDAVSLGKWLLDTFADPTPPHARSEP